MFSYCHNILILSLTQFPGNPMLLLLFLVTTLLGDTRFVTLYLIYPSFMALHLFIHSFNKSYYIFYVPAIVLGTKDIAMNKTMSVLSGLTF